MNSKESVKLISTKLKESRNNKQKHQDLIKIYSRDERKGVIQFVARENKYLEQQAKLYQRAEQMLEIEKHYLNQGLKYIAGVDEAGRGPLAGPVVAASVILPLEYEHNYLLNDSKKLNESTRNFLYNSIINSAIDVQVAFVTPTEIDEINILNASLLAMANSVIKLKPQAQLVLVDGHKKIPSLKTPQRVIIKGDAKVRAIAAASIIAKVYRDNLMGRMALFYPHYKFKTHKGYPTELHRQKISEFGHSPIHRKTFKWSKDEL